ncbi:MULTISPECIES: lycopene cyclase domain-containing protein [unclassified Agromyces]|uniref:lycopene cyclase domain-containing protein n=1 Tax=unclassified Agromyces TaxID=2639701 RepID=UPI003015573F
MTYALMSLPFLLVAVLAAWAWRPRELRAARRRRIATLVAAAALVVLTAVFDSVIIGTGIVAYDDGQRSGVTIGLAPIEDFLYPIAGVLLLPAAWRVAVRRWPGRSAPAAAGDGIEHTEGRG